MEGGFRVQIWRLEKSEEGQVYIQCFPLVERFEDDLEAGEKG